MSVTLINNHVLFPETPHWSEAPQWSRAWENEISPAVTAAETRVGLRIHPRQGVTFTLLATTPSDVARLEDRVRAAAKSGLACCPLHGLAATLATSVSGITCAVRNDGRNWQIGDALFFRAPSGLHEIGIIADVSPSSGVVTLTLTEEITGTYTAGNFVWPLLFGKFSGEQMPVRTPRFTFFKLTLTEMTSAAAVPLGEVIPPTGSGIGFMSVNSTFQIT